MTNPATTMPAIPAVDRLSITLLVAAGADGALVGSEVGVDAVICVDVTDCKAGTPCCLAMVCRVEVKAPEFTLAVKLLAMPLEAAAGVANPAS